MVDSDSLWWKYGFESSSYAHYMFYVQTVFAIFIFPALILWIFLLPFCWKWRIFKFLTNFLFFSAPIRLLLIFTYDITLFSFYNIRRSTIDWAENYQENFWSVTSIIYSIASVTFIFVVCCISSFALFKNIFKDRLKEYYREFTYKNLPKIAFIWFYSGWRFLYAVCLVWV